MPQDPALARSADKSYTASREFAGRFRRATCNRHRWSWWARKTSRFASAADVAWPIKGRSAPGKRRGRPPRLKVRLDLRLYGATLLPVRADINGKGTSEPAAASQHVEPGTVYVTDRGYASLRYAHHLLDAGATFVLRVKRDARVFQTRDGAGGHQPLDADDRAANVITDRLGRLVGSPHMRAAGVVTP